MDAVSVKKGLFFKAWQIFLELNSRKLYRSSGKGKEKRCLGYTSSTEREIRHFHVVVLQWRQRNVQRVWCTCKVSVLPLPLLSPSCLFKLSNNIYISVMQVIRLAVTSLNILLLGRLHQKHLWQMQQNVQRAWCRCKVSVLPLPLLSPSCLF